MLAAASIPLAGIRFTGLSDSFSTKTENIVSPHIWAHRSGKWASGQMTRRVREDIACHAGVHADARESSVLLHTVTDSAAVEYDTKEEKMKIAVITVGKIKEKYLRDAIAEYSKRLSRYCKLEVIEVADEKTPDQASETVEDNIRTKEGERLMKYIRV